MSLSRMDARKTIAWLWTSGTKEPKKIQELTNIPKTTVYRIIKRIKEDEGLEDKPRSGRPPKLSDDDRRRVAQLALNHRYWSSTLIAEEAHRRGSPKVQKSTICRALKKSGIRKWHPKTVTALSEEQKRNRREWCLRHRNRDWSRVLFTDESYFQLFRNKLKAWSRTRPEKPQPKWGPTIMVWGGISLRGTTTLALRKGSITAERYVEILQENMASIYVFYPGGFVFQQDNATSHTAKYARQWFESQGYEVIDWPANSPDLNPIENLWRLMKDALQKELERSSENWMVRIQEIWDNIVPNYLESLINSMPDRIEACIAANGGRINY
jgi:transposase